MKRTIGVSGYNYTTRTGKRISVKPYRKTIHKFPPVYITHMTINGERRLVQISTKNGKRSVKVLEDRRLAGLISLDQAKRHFEKQSERAKKLDLKKTSKQTFNQDIIKESYIRNDGTGRYDVEGIDTPTSKTSVNTKETKKKLKKGQLWKECPICGKSPVCVDCMKCKKHCTCKNEEPRFTEPTLQEKQKQEKEKKINKKISELQKISEWPTDNEKETIKELQEASKLKEEAVYELTEPIYGSGGWGTIGEQISERITVYSGVINGEKVTVLKTFSKGYDTNYHDWKIIRPSRPKQKTTLPKEFKTKGSFQMKNKKYSFQDVFKQVTSIIESKNEEEIQKKATDKYNKLLRSVPPQWKMYAKTKEEYLESMGSGITRKDILRDEYAEIIQEAFKDTIHRRVNTHRATSVSNFDEITEDILLKNLNSIRNVRKHQIGREWKQRNY